MEVCTIIYMYHLIGHTLRNVYIAPSILFPINLHHSIYTRHYHLLTLTQILLYNLQTIQCCTSFILYFNFYHRGEPRPHRSFVFFKTYPLLQAAYDTSSFTSENTQPSFSGVSIAHNACTSCGPAPIHLIV